MDRLASVQLVLFGIPSVEGDPQIHAELVDLSRDPFAVLAGCLV